MKSLNNSLFQKNEIYNLSSIVGGSVPAAPTTKHEATWDGDHYECDHSKDTSEEL